MKIKGLKKIAGESKKLTGFYSPEYLQLNYNTTTGEAWTNYHYSIFLHYCISILLTSR